MGKTKKLSADVTLKKVGGKWIKTYPGKEPATPQQIQELVMKYRRTR